MQNKTFGKLFVISGPSGVGKGTLIEKLLQIDPNIKLSVSATTRMPRPHEKDGINYHFVSKENFEQLIKEDKLIEWAKFSDNYYGTFYETVEKNLQNGDDLILEIEVKGAMQIKEKMPEAVLIFVLPPSFEELKNRLISRNTEKEEEILKRLSIFEEEYSKSHQFNYKVINDNLDNALDELHEIVLKERHSLC